jgi:hypothetical protein
MLIPELRARPEDAGRDDDRANFTGGKLECCHDFPQPFLKRFIAT